MKRRLHCCSEKQESKKTKAMKPCKRMVTWYRANLAVFDVAKIPKDITALSVDVPPETDSLINHDVERTFPYEPSIN